MDVPICIFTSSYLYIVSIYFIYIDTYFTALVRIRDKHGKDAHTSVFSGAQGAEIATHCNTLHYSQRSSQHTATPCATLHHTALHFTTLQYTTLALGIGTCSIGYDDKFSLP